MLIRLKKYGCSYVVLVPKKVLKILGWDETVELTLKLDSSKIVISKATDEEIIKGKEI